MSDKKNDQIRQMFATARKRNLYISFIPQEADEDGLTVEFSSKED